MFQGVLSFVEYIDQAVATHVYWLRGPFLNRFFYGVTLLGNMETVVAVAIILAVIAFFIHRKRVWALFFAALALGTSMTVFSKELIGRNRPTDNIIPLPQSHSFPSGHALLGTICYGLIGYYIYTHAKNSFIRIFGLVFMIAVPFCLGFSRIYLGVHWTSDVVAGWIGGAVVVIICARIAHAHQSLQNKRQ